MKIGLLIGFCLLLWIICYFNTGSDQKNIKSFYSYPKDIQELVRNDQKLSEFIPKENNLFTVFISNMLLFTILFLLVGLLIQSTSGFKNDFDTFLYFLILGETINAFDFIVIDLLWWRNTPRIRFSCALDKQLYQNPKVHFESFLRGIVMYLCVALIVTSIFMMFS